MTAVRCDHCGAPLELADVTATVRCQYCQHTHVVAALVAAVDAPTLAPAVMYLAGQAVLCEWRGRWWRARVLEVQPGGYLVHYDGYSSSWDETVGADRLRPPGAPLTSTQPSTPRASGGRGLGVAVALFLLCVVLPVVLWTFTRGDSPAGSTETPLGAQPSAAGQLVPGQAVSVYWGSRWYDATVLTAQPDGRVRIHYDGWADSWDEDVTLDRVRLR